MLTTPHVNDSLHLQSYNGQVAAQENVNWTWDSLQQAREAATAVKAQISVLQDLSKQVMMDPHDAHAPLMPNPC